MVILSGGQLYSERGVLNDSAIVINNKKIEAIISQDEIKNYPSAQVYHFPENYYFLPGFIDMHIHGANGYDVMDAHFSAFAEISRALALEGTTSYLATTMTAAENEIANVLSHARDYIEKQDEVVGAEMLGVHLEGPFLSPNKVGAQRSDLILTPDKKYIEQWQTISKNSIKLVTLAPELENSLEFIRYLKQNNIIASIGHTDATYDETQAAIAAGCSHATHLFNAMRGLHQRQPGAVTSILLSNSINSELIVDGVHLHPAIVELAFKLKTKDKIVLVTDAMRAKCLADGEYDLGGQLVEVKKGVARLKDGTLAGSTLKMSEAIKNMIQFVNCSIDDVIKMTSENPAKSLGVFDRKGSIAKNKDADLVVLNENFDVVMTVCLGRLQHSSHPQES